jgi:hypothetical protein
MHSYLLDGDVAGGFPIVKFNLVYDGPLHSQGAANIFGKKWKIREYLHPQLAELWRVHPSLRNVWRYLPVGGYFQNEVHHSVELPEPVLDTRVEHMDLQRPIEIGGVNFLPLVRDSYALVCSLKILFMRKEPAGRVYVGGDLDNRIKVFLDALKVPQKSEAALVAQVNPQPTEALNCLLEDDTLITGLTVESTRLLDAPNVPESYARLIAEVTVGVTHPHGYNAAFLGE